ncbi:hypothetical protein KSP40_PGU001561 [Platanthera guangdongensis]|uniref:Uncharacterized protein n=1 Tax=Platanthera guangdongensis TaxID=2320717 RepID=A0ABR2M1N4_9ASPA
METHTQAKDLMNGSDFLTEVRPKPIKRCHHTFTLPSPFFFDQKKKHCFQEFATLITGVEAIPQVFACWTSLITLYNGYFSRLRCGVREKERRRGLKDKLGKAGYLIGLFDCINEVAAAIVAAASSSAAGMSDSVYRVETTPRLAQWRIEALSSFTLPQVRSVQDRPLELVRSLSLFLPVLKDSFNWFRRRYA